MASQNNFLFKIYAFRFLSEFLLIIPLFAVLFVDHGLSTIQITILFLVWSGTSFILDVPTGILADKYSRKHLLFFAQIAQSMCFVLWVFMPTFIGFFIGNVLWGIRDALISGTFEALVYDELHTVGKKDAYAKIIGRAGTAYFLSTMLSCVLASFAVGLGYNFILTISAFAAAMAGLLCLFFPSVPQSAKVEKQSLRSLTAKSWRILSTDSKLRMAVFSATLPAILSMGLFEFWTLIANQAGLSHAGLGIFIAVIAAVQAIASFLAHKLEQASELLLYGAFVLGGFVIVLLGISLTIYALALIIAFNFIFTLLITVFGIKLQHSCPADVRVTVLSVKGFFTQIGIFIMTASFGFVANINSYSHALCIFGALIMLLGLSWYWYQHAHRNV